MTRVRDERAALRACSLSLSVRGWSGSDRRVKRLFRAALEHVGVEAARSYWDSIYLRVVPAVEGDAERQMPPAPSANPLPQDPVTPGAVLAGDPDSSSHVLIQTPATLVSPTTGQAPRTRH